MHYIFATCGNSAPIERIYGIYLDQIIYYGTSTDVLIDLVRMETMIYCIYFFKVTERIITLYHVSTQNTAILSKNKIQCVAVDIFFPNS